MAICIEHTLCCVFSSGTPLQYSNSQKHKRFELPAVVTRARGRRIPFAFADETGKGQLHGWNKRIYAYRGTDALGEIVETSKMRGRSKEQFKTGRKVSTGSQSTTATKRRTHRILRIIRGKAYGRKLLSPIGMDVRPMMELVRRAAFDILQAACGSSNSLPPGKWLDLYSGTGSVGIEAMSRGCFEAHFVEMDPWIVENVLRPNVEHTGFNGQSVIHTVRVESFLERFGKKNCELQSFDYISVTPPYQTVNYTILMEQLSRSPLIGKDAFILVEHPSSIEMNDHCGALSKIVDRRYGRTYLAIYGPEWSQKRKAS
eukprot:TRINITY_DN22132_c0_g1_i1.p1 TRINITY_DN22132_c0_g1~~TRINITY_DN22132_c0_g1_i1.p1  ORF type:complete len:315 (-),score=52.00 TRINITY_DN22132_c0_g1_i1:305-1249(-)